MELALREKNQKIWNSFIDDTYRLVRKFEFGHIPVNSEKFIVLIEPRENPHLEYVLRNAMHFLGPEWGLQIFIGQNNKKFVEDIVKDWGYVHIHQLKTDNLNAHEYNEMKKSPEFWQLVKGEYVLWIEPDCIVCNSNIEEFMDYDYVGAPWKSEMSISRKVRVGNGGLSLRRKTSMLEIASSCNRNPAIFPQEDLFFAVNMILQKDKYRLPEVEVAQRFSVETIFYPEPFGLHKTWKYLEEDQLRLLLNTVKYV